jgi:hypothetical protein
MQREEVCGYLGRSVTATIAFGNGGYAIHDVRVTIRAVDDDSVTLTVTPPISVDPEHEALWNQPHRIRLEQLLSLKPTIEHAEGRSGGGD